MTYIYRDKEVELRKFLKKPEIIAVTGPRQAGKTTLVQHVLKDEQNTATYSFDDVELSRIFRENPDAFYARYIKPYDVVFLDEIQSVEDGGRLLKYLYDTYRPRIIVSGSSAPDIAIHSLQYLVGRVSIVEVFPLSLKEFIHYKDKHLYKLLSNTTESRPHNKDLEQYTSEYLTYGGYPRAVLEETNEGKVKVLENIYRTLFLREIHDMASFADNDKMYKLITAIALAQGGMLSYKTLSDASGYAHESLKRLLSILEGVYIIKSVQPYFKNKLKEISKAPKTFFLDPGLRNFAIRDFRSHELRTDKGGMLEAITLRVLMSVGVVHYWRDKMRHEIDFVCLGEQLLPKLFECKWSTELIRPEILASWEAIHGKSPDTVVSFTGKPFKNTSYIWELG